MVSPAPPVFAYAVETLTLANLDKHHAGLVTLAVEHGERHIRQACLDWLRVLGPETLPSGAILLATVEGADGPVGMTVGLEPMPGLEGPNFNGPNFTVVHRDYRRRGIALALMQRKLARLAVYETLVAPDNEASIGLMERAGLVRIGLVDNGFGKKVLRYRRP